MPNTEFRESETTIRFGMKIVVLDKSNGLYVGEKGSSGTIQSARKFASVGEAKEYCSTNGITGYRIIAHVPGAVAGNTIILAETGTVAENGTGKPRFD